MSHATHVESRYRVGFVALWALAALSLAALTVAGYAVVGVALFALFGVAATALPSSYDGPLFDERDDERYRAASTTTIGILGMGSAVFFPTMTALHALDLYQWPAWLSPIAVFVAALFVVHTAAFALASYR